MVWEIWFPHALTIGVSDTMFWHLNPKKLKPYEIAYKRQNDIKNSYAHLQGIYYRDALANVLSGMFGKKGNTPIPYPKEPYQIDNNNVELTETDKIQQTNALFRNLEIMKKNFELNKKQKEGVKSGEN